MKKTGRITLGLMGTLFVTGCTPEPDTLRNTYRTREDCVADYNESECAPADRGASGDWNSNSASGSGVGVGRWYGPLYRGGGSFFGRDDPGPGRDPNRPLLRETIKRGGFGQLGRFFFRGS